MFHQPEDSSTIIKRDRIAHQNVIQTDLALSETIGDSDSDTEDSFDAKTTVRENYEYEEEFNPSMLSERSLNTGRRILGPVSSHNSQ